MEINVNELWDFGDPELSEQRFHDAMADADPHGRFVLRTQIARTHGLRRNFVVAKSTLSELEPELKETSAEGQVRYWLEHGRCHCSAAHTEEMLTEEARRIARESYLQGFEVARTSGLDGLAIDALHMMSMVEKDQAAQIEWNRKALAYMEESTHPEAKRWEGSLRNNLGYALRLAGRFDEALDEFQKALAYREQSGNPESVRVARWMIAWTLRGMDRLPEALEMQLGLEQEWAREGEEDPYVFDELEEIYRAMGDGERAEHYAAKVQIHSEVPS